MPAPSTLHGFLLCLTLGLAACSLDPQPEPPMSSGASGFAGAGGAWVPGPDAGQSGGSALADASGNDVLSDAAPCTGCAENKCGDADADCPCDQADGGCDGDACACDDADADACTTDAPESDGDSDDATIDASLD